MLSIQQRNTIKPVLTSTRDTKHLTKPIIGELVIGIDTEYVQRPNYPNQMITTQLATSEDTKDCIVLEHPTLGISRLPSWSGKSIFPDAMGLERTPNPAERYVIIKGMMFFAPSDLLSGLFNDAELIETIQAHCKQDARITLKVGSGKFPKTYIDINETVIYNGQPTGFLLRVCDLGKLAVGGLLQTCEGLGITMSSKTLLDDHKVNMLVPYTDPAMYQTFDDYAKDDACVLFKLVEANEERVSKIYGTHNLPVPKTTPLTTGSMVAGLFRTYIEHHLGRNDAYKLFPHVGIKDRQDALDNLLSQSNVTYYARIAATTAQVNALVQGGRAKNEQPLTHRVEGCLIDTDIAGAYVTKMRQMYYPIGIPSTYSIHECSDKQSHVTLGQFLEIRGNQLVPDCWHIIVSGTLEHHQTLVPSKIADPFNVVVQETYSEDDPKIDADFVLTTRQITNGVITHDVIQAIKAVATDREWAQWKSLRVISAVWYAAKDRHDTPESWSLAVSEHHTKTGNNVVSKRNKYGNEYHDDLRSRAWYAMSIGDFLTPYAEERKRLKTLMKSCSKGTLEYSQYDAQQNAMKLVGNVLYGVLASPFFVIGNVVTANNITAGIRTFAWLSAVSLGFNQSITDGGGHDANRARYRTGSMPGFNTLSLLHMGDKFLGRGALASIKIAPLGGGSEWEVTEGFTPDTSLVSNGDVTVEGKDGSWSIFDAMCKEHVVNFFDGCILDCLSYFDFEIKDVYIRGVYHGQTNYKFIQANGQEKIKVRGQEIKRTHYSDVDCLHALSNGEIAIIQLLNAMDSESPCIPAYQIQYKSQVLKMNAANIMRTSKTKDSVYHTNGVRAGDSISKRTWVRPLSLSMFHWNNYQQLLIWEKRNCRDKIRYGYGLEGYFVDGDGYVDYRKMITRIQEAIYKGDNWVPEFDKRKPSPHPYAEHAIQDAATVYELEGYSDEDSDS